MSRIGDVKLSGRCRIKGDFSPLVGGQSNVLAEGDRRITCFGNRASNRPADRRVRPIYGVHVHRQVCRVGSGQRKDGLHVGIAQYNRARRIQKDLAPEAGIHIWGLRLPVHGAEGEILAVVEGRSHEQRDRIGCPGIDEASHVIFVYDHRPNRVRVNLCAVEPNLGAIAYTFKAQPILLSRNNRGCIELAAIPPILCRQIRDGLEIRPEVNILIDVICHESCKDCGRNGDGIPTRDVISGL